MKNNELIRGNSYHCFMVPTASAATCITGTNVASLPAHATRGNRRRRRRVPPPATRGGRRAAGHRSVSLLRRLPTPLLPEPNAQPLREAPGERGGLPLSSRRRRPGRQRGPHRGGEPGHDVPVPPPGAGAPAELGGEVARVAAEAVAGELRAGLQLYPLLEHQRPPRPPLQLHAVHGWQRLVSCTAAQ